MGPSIHDYVGCCSPVTDAKIKAYLAAGGDPNAYVGSCWLVSRSIVTLPLKYPVVGIPACLFYSLFTPLTCLCVPCSGCWQEHILLLVASDDASCQLPWWNNEGAVDKLLAAGANADVAAVKGACAPHGNIWEHKEFAGYKNRQTMNVRMGAPEETEMEK